MNAKRKQGVVYGIGYSCFAVVGLALACWKFLTGEYLIGAEFGFAALCLLIAGVYVWLRNTVLPKT